MKGAAAMMIGTPRLSNALYFWLLAVWIGGHGSFASITFVATSQKDLTPRALPAELAVQSNEDLVSRTKAYASLYKASILRNNGNSGEAPSPTEIKPNVMLVRGSSVADSDHNGKTIQASPYGFVGAATTAYGYHADLVIRPDDIWITIF